MSINWSLYEKKIKINGNSFKERQIDFMKSAILDDFENNPSYTEVYFNNSDIITGIQIVDDKYGLKKVLMKPDENINAGDLLEFNSNKWICINVDKENPVYQYGTIQKTTNTLKFHDKNHNLYQIPCIVDSNTRFQDLRLEENKFISEPDDKITIRIAYSDITKNIERGQIFKLIDNDNYKVISVNKVTEPGLIVLKMEYEIQEQTLPNYSLTILNGDNIQISQSQSLTINTKLTDNGVEVPSLTLLFSSNDENVATIDSNGVVSVVGVGVVTFTVSLASDNTVNDSIVVEIVAVETHNYTSEISGATSITKGYTSNYSCIFKDNGNLIVQQSEFYLTGDDGVSSTTLAQIVSQDTFANTCVVKGLGIGYVKLFVKSVDGSIVSQPLRIQIKNLF